MASTRRISPGSVASDGERGAVLVLVLVVLVLFVMIGGFAAVYVSNMRNLVVNREQGLHAYYGAEAALNAMVTQAMTDTSDHPGIRLDDIESLPVDVNTAGDAVIEAGPQAGGNFDYRVWTRGYGLRPGGARVQRYIRAYLRFDADSGNRHVQLVDMEELRENAVSRRAHQSLELGSVAAPSPAVDRVGSVLHGWLPSDHSHRDMSD